MYYFTPVCTSASYTSRIRGSSPLTLPEGNYLGGEERNTVFLHHIFCPYFWLNLDGFSSILIALCCKCRLQIATSQCVSLKTWCCLLNDTVQATLFCLSFDSFLRLRDKIVDRLAALMFHLIDDEVRWLMNQAISDSLPWTKQTINSSPNGVISLSRRKFR